MYLTRPKSSKGRSRPAPSPSPYAGDTDDSQRPPLSSESPVNSRPDRNFRSLSQPVTWQAGQLSQDQVLCVLHHNPSASAPPQSLNKYKVLPSIERRPPEGSPEGSLDKNMSELTLEGAAQYSQGHVDPGPAVAKHPGTSGGLLLAIRAPCGRRFQQHFEPTDTLWMVKASAEARFGTQYGEASIETMDRPRRSFTDMDMTLAQCGIITKSVLCIFQNNTNETEHERA